jgi:hypothetical protein
MVGYLQPKDNTYSWTTSLTVIRAVTNKHANFFLYVEFVLTLSSLTTIGF